MSFQQCCYAVAGRAYINVQVDVMHHPSVDILPRRVIHARLLQETVHLFDPLRMATYTTCRDTYQACVGTLKYGLHPVRAYTTGGKDRVEREGQMGDVPVYRGGGGGGWLG